jgi:quercetin dioxygenase-like cupin family protein
VLTAQIEGFHAQEIQADADMSVLLLSDAPRAIALFVLDGELTLRLDDGTRPLVEGTWAFVPAGVNHSLATGSRPSRFLRIQVGRGSSREVVVRRADGAEGDRITDLPDRRATVLVETEELTISEFLYGPGQRGAQRHVHHEHADAFLVLEGELTFHLRDESLALPAGTLVVVPPGVVHGFDNDSAAFMRCFNFHMPSLGFADYMRGRNPGFDQLHPPANGGVDPAALITARLAL